MTTTREIEGSCHFRLWRVIVLRDGEYMLMDIAVLYVHHPPEDEVTFLAGLANHIYLFTPYMETNVTNTIT